MPGALASKLSPSRESDGTDGLRARIMAVSRCPRPWRAHWSTWTSMESVNGRRVCWPGCLA
eukprot:100630-Prymnesium_polylepis.1